LTEVQSIHARTFGTIGIDAKVLGLASQFYGLPGQEMADAVSRQSVDWIGPSSLAAAPSEEVVVSQSGYLYHSGLESEEQWSCSTLPENRNVGTAYIDNEAFDMLNSPEIPGSFKSKLHIGPEIEKRLGDDRHINFVFNHVVNIVLGISKDLCFGYRVDAYLRGNEYDDGWERVELIIEFPEDHYDDIAEYWKKVSMHVSEFYKSLQNVAEFSDDIIARMRKTIYIIVRSGE
jgi:hypothetical protein